MNIGDRLKLLRIANKFTENEVAEKLNITKQTLYNYENNITADIPTSKIKELANLYKVEPSFIIGWKEPSISAKKTEQTINIKNIMPLINQSILFLGELGSAKAFENATDDDYINIYTNEHIDCDFAIKVNGDSMINARINHGDMVFVKKNK